MNQRILFFTLGLALSPLSVTPSYADHTTDNSANTAQLAYRLADTAESLERYARNDGGGFRPFPITNKEGFVADSTLGGGSDVTDHRSENLMELSMVARRLHLAASDLYRAARWNLQGGEPNNVVERDLGSDVLDHDGDRIRYVYDRVRIEYDNLRRYYGNLGPYVIDQNIHILVRDIDQAYTALEWSVYGIRN